MTVAPSFNNVTALARSKVLALGNILSTAISGVNAKGKAVPLPRVNREQLLVGLTALNAAIEPDSKANINHDALKTIAAPAINFLSQALTDVFNVFGAAIGKGLLEVKDLKPTLEALLKGDSVRTLCMTLDKFLTLADSILKPPPPPLKLSPAKAASNSPARDTPPAAKAKKSPRTNTSSACRVALACPVTDGTFFEGTIPPNATVEGASISGQALDDFGAPGSTRPATGRRRD